MGVHGDATTATPGKGEVIFEAAVTGLAEVVDDLRNWKIAPRRNQHTNPVQSGIRW